MQKTDFALFDKERCNTTVITLPDYPMQISRTALSSVDYVLLLGGIKQLRRVWDDFGALIPKFRDFRQIYLACTDEGDRYCDDFLTIRVGRGQTADPSEVFFWSSLRRDPSKSVTLEVDDTDHLEPTAEAAESEAREEAEEREEESESIRQRTTEENSDATPENEECCIL